MLLLALFTALLSSCIEGDEEIFLNADGSARMIAVYSLPAIIFSDEDAAKMKEQIAKELGEEEKINLLTNKIERSSGKQVITIEIEAANILDLEALMDKGEDENKQDASKSEQVLDALLGELSFRREGLAAGVNRKVDLKPLLDKFVGERWPSMLGDSEFRYTVHFPKPVKASNAHEVSNGGKTVKWAYKLNECGENPIELDVVTSVPLPWWVYAILVILILLLLLGAWKMVCWARRP